VVGIKGSRNREGLFFLLSFFQNIDLSLFIQHLRRLSSNRTRSRTKFLSRSLQAANMRSTLLPFAALALLFAVAAHPINEQDAKDLVDFHVFPEFASLASLDDLVDRETFGSDTDVDFDVDGDGDDKGETIEARAANQCTLAKLKDIMFDWSECHSCFPPSPKASVHN
jgi:hypothetical protein